VSFDIDAHEYNGRWFNDISAWNVARVDAAAVNAAQPAPTPSPADPAPFPPAPAATAEANSADDLPF